MTYRRILPLLASFAAALACHAAAPIELPVWPGVAPHSENHTDQETWQERGKNGAPDRAVRHVNIPTITVYQPEPASASHLAILIAPGGGYEHVTIDKEGHDVARWLAAHGITSAVLKYRLPKTPGGGYTVDDAYADAMQALKVMRAHAGGWHFDPAKLGMMGFSAGGHLTILAGTKPPKNERPAFLVPMYPAVPDGYESASDLAPIFIGQASDDPLLNSGNALRFYTWARSQKAPIELHLFLNGGHGFGLGKPGTPTAEWPELFLAWLHSIGLLGRE
jgi:acetyl esterase/lipase